MSASPDVLRWTQNEVSFITEVYDIGRLRMWAVIDGRIDSSNRVVGFIRVTVSDIVDHHDHVFEEPYQDLNACIKWFMAYVRRTRDAIEGGRELFHWLGFDMPGDVSNVRDIGGRDYVCTISPIPGGSSAPVAYILALKCNDTVVAQSRFKTADECREHASPLFKRYMKRENSHG